MRRLFLIATILTLWSTGNALAQVHEDKPAVIYGQTRRMPIGGISVEGVQNYEDYLLIGISGLSVGDMIEFPGEDISQAIKRYWKHGLFSTVKIEADKIQNDSIFLKIILSLRPRVEAVNINGVKKSEKDDLMEKIGIIKGNQITPNMVDRAKIVAKKYFDEKGFKNAKIDIVQHDDINNPNQLIVDMNIDKQEKVKVRNIIISGNEHIKRKKFIGGFFGGGLLKKTNEKGFKSLFKTKKFVEEKYAEDKERIIENLDSAEVELTDAELEQLESELNKCKVYGHRGLGGF